MAQEDYVIEDQTGVSFLGDLNNTLEAIVSNNSGATQPTLMYPYQWWADTTSGILKQRNTANNAWINKSVLSAAFDTTLEIGATKTSRKNLLINGNFDINQRAVGGTVSLSAGAYGHDMFKGGASGATYTFATSANVTTLTITAGSLIQVVEGLSLFTGTYVLSFDGTAQGKIGGGSFANSGVTGSITGGANTSIEFNTGTISKVQLEKSLLKTEFEVMALSEITSSCERFFQTGTMLLRGAGSSVRGVSNPIKTTMRAAPTVAITAVSGSSVAIAVQGSSSLFLSGTTASSGFLQANFTLSSVL
jgi:hypothetical protein